MFLALAAGLVLGAAGLGLIRHAWLQRQNRHSVALASGWGLVALAALPLSHALGGDRGVTTAFAVPILAAIALMSVGLARALPAAPVKTVSAPDRDRALWYASLRTIAVIALCGPLAMTVAALAAMALFQGVLLAGWSMADALFTAMLFAPLAWAGLAVWAALDAPLRWRTGVLTLAGLGTGALTYTLMMISSTGA